MSIFDNPTGGNAAPNQTPLDVSGAPVPWQDCYPAWAARGLIPLRSVGEVFTKAGGQEVSATGKEPIHPNWQSLPAQREAVNESQFETFSDIEHEIERGRNIGLVVPPGVVCLDMDQPTLRDAVLAIYPTAAAQLTQGGGLHLFFKTKPGEQFTGTTKAEVDGINYDIRSAGRSQLVCYPSTGLRGSYRWLRPLPIDIDSLPLRPESLLKYLDTSSRTGVASVVPRHQEYGAAPVNPDRPTAKAYEAIKQIDDVLYRRIVQKKPLSPTSTERNNTMIKVVGMILGTCVPKGEAPSPELPYAILLPNILADNSGTADNPAPTVAELWSACCRLCDHELAQWWERQSLLAVTTAISYEKQQEADAEAQEVAQGIAETMNISADELKKQAILYLPNGKHYYVLDETKGGYAGPTSSNGLLQRINQGCQKLFDASDIYDVSNQGALSMRPINMLLRDFGQPVTRIDRLAGLHHPLYNKADETMVMGVWAAREMEPEFNKSIDQWLRLLGGDDYETLAAWLATVTETHRPNSCLYIKGPKAIGKSLLMDGLARLWGRKATRYRDVMARFNDSFVNCPLVHLDEGLSDHTDSLRFREFISEVEHVIETKGQPQYTLRGSARVVVTSNNVNALKINEALNTDDIDAISSRICWISTDHMAAKYLKRLHGRQTTESWVEDDLIAKHVLWLRDNTQIETEGHENRFMVPGNYHTEKLHMLRTHRSNSTLFEVVASYVIEAATAPGNNFPRYTDGILFTEGTVAMRWKGIAEYWSGHEKLFGKLPNPREAAGSLKIFSREIERSKRTCVGARKFYIADYDLLMDEIERLAPDELIKDIEDFLMKSIDDGTSKV